MPVLSPRHAFAHFPPKAYFGANHVHSRTTHKGHVLWSVCLGACVSVCVGQIIHVFVFTTSGGKLLGVDDFGSIFLSRGDLHAPPDHRERTPGKKRLEQY